MSTYDALPSYCYTYTVNNPLKYIDPSGYKLRGFQAMGDSPSRDNDKDFYGGGGGGISWPRFGTLNGPRNSFEADVMLAEQFYQQGDMFAYSYLNDQI